MSEPVNFDLWQSAAGDGPVNLDLGATPDSELVISASIRAINQLTSGNIDAAIIYTSTIHAVTKRTDCAVYATNIWSLLFQTETKTCQGDIYPDSILGASFDVHAKTSCNLHADYLLNGDLDSSTAVLTSQFDGSYDINVYRDPSGSGGDVWVKQAKIAHREPGNSDWSMSARAHPAKRIVWDEAALCHRLSDYIFDQLPVLDPVSLLGHADADALNKNPGWFYQDLPRNRATFTSAHKEAQDASLHMISQFLLVLPRNHVISAHRGQLPVYRDASLTGQKLRKGRALFIDGHSLYEEAIWPMPGISDHTQPPEPTTPNTGDVDLDFIRLRQLTTDLEFWIDVGNARIIPIRRVYLVSNSASLVRLRDGMNIPVTGISIDYDDDSWAWQFSASVPRIAMAEALYDEEVLIELNGYQWIMSVDGWSDSLSFNNQNATVTGRSRTKELSNAVLLPSSYTETQARTMIQLAEQELVTGWALDWQSTDWLVPGGVWSYSNKTPIELIQTLAQAAGSFVYPDPSQRLLHILPRYKTKPWVLSQTSADIVIPANVMVNRGRKFELGTNANAIWLSGQNGGITTRVKRTGTAADRLLPTEVVDLITHVDGATAYGIERLANSLTRSIDTIELPISSDTGLILPGNIIEVPDGKAYPRGVRVSATLNDRKLVIRQSIEIERPIEV